jgi:hypothetical protein
MCQMVERSGRSSVWEPLATSLKSFGNGRFY